MFLICLYKYKLHMLQHIVYIQTYPLGYELWPGYVQHLYTYRYLYIPLILLMLYTFTIGNNVGCQNQRMMT